MDAGSIWIKLGLDSTNLEQGLNKAKTDLTQWKDTTEQTKTSMLGLGTATTQLALIVVAAAAASRSAAQEYGGMAQQLKDLNLVTDISTGKLQQLKYASVLSGDNFGSVSTSLAKLSVSMAEAQDNTSAAAKAFDQLGVNPAGKSPDQVFEETAVALMGMEDVTARNQIAMELYGRSYRDILPFMQDYIKNRNEIVSRAVISDDDLDRLDRAKTGWDKLGDSAYNFGAVLTARTQQIQEFSKSVNPLSSPVEGALGWAYNAIVGAPAEESASKAATPAKQPATTDFTQSTALKTLAAATKDAFSKMSDAAKDYEKSLEKTADARKKLADIEKDYRRELSVANVRDVAGLRNLRIQHQWSTEDQMANIADTERGAASSKAAYAAATETAGKAGAKYGDVIVKVGNEQLARVVGVAMGTANRQNGIGVF